MQLRIAGVRALCVFGCLAVSPWFVIAAIADARQEVRSFSDVELLEALREANGEDKERDNLLTEIVRRGGKQWERELRGLVDGQKSQCEKWEQYLSGLIKGQNAQHEKTDPQGVVRLPPHHVPDRYVALLTALRRLQNKPDPLTVLVAGKATVNCKKGALPVVQVLLTNLDVDREPVTIQSGGNYRSGRLARWRFVVRDASDHELPQNMSLGLMGGGISGERILEYGESWTARLRMADYVDVFVPGQYTVQILYHDEIAIANCENVDGLIVSRSLPLKLTVDPIEVEITKKSRQAVRKHIRSLPATGPIKFLRGPYSERVHDFIAAESSCGRLLALGWDAAPDLIEAALDPQLDPVRRAQILAILFSVTSQNDPRVRGVLGPYEYRDSNWMFLSEPIDEAPFAMSGGTHSKSVRTRNIDVEAQMRFAEQWRVWIGEDYIRVKQTAQGEGKREGNRDRSD